MAKTKYWLSFEVSKKASSKGTDGVRRQSLYSAIDVYDDNHWDETTSFVLFEAPDDIDVVGRAIVKGLDETLDKIVIRKVASSTARYWGEIGRKTGLSNYLDGIKPLTAA